MGTAMMLVVAGHQSSVTLLGNAAPSLLQNPDQLRLLREQPRLVPGAVEEFLRHDTSVEPSTSRHAADDIELGGVAIPRGGMVVIALGAGGRDAPQAGGGDPAVLNVARLESTIALRTLLARVPELELAVSADSLEWIGSGIIRGALSLPVRYRVG
ncbi:hypothetical protein ABZS88_37080 [Streptomyces sp. NPDC005480]|uniref:hypothetical protein n=1 Tax=Streptomyces sp. NPDC005480 TaxID=3154880 RepID=UPI0033B17B6D